MCIIPWSTPHLVVHHCLSVSTGRLKHPQEIISSELQWWVGGVFIHIQVISSILISEVTEVGSVKRVACGTPSPPDLKLEVVGSSYQCSLGTNYPLG